jgi:hypothetical protein
VRELDPPPSLHPANALAGDDVEVVVGELARTLAQAAAELVPIALRRF